ncbi:MAG: beta family protein [Terracidiphilus sp.]
MFQHNHYVPVLKWKMGEYQALSRLSDQAKGRITPLLEIPPVGYDFEAREDRESLSSHLGDFGRRLRSKWQSRQCFVDLKYVPAKERLAGQHPVDFVFGQTRDEGLTAVPVVSLSSDKPFLRAVSKVVQTDQHGAALRITRPDFDKDAMETEIDDCLSAVGVRITDADLIVDLDTPDYVPIRAFVRNLMIMYEMIPTPNRWRTLTIVGSSYPKSVSDLESRFVTRYHWLAYKAFVSALGRDSRIPTFGDYAAAPLDPPNLDMRMIKPLAKLRYTKDDEWYIAVGSNVRTNGFGQYRDMCAELIRQPFFSGNDFSDADRYIYECAKGTEKTGNLSTWVWVATNRHLTKVVYDLANLYAS